MNTFIQIIVTFIFITILFLGFIEFYKRNKPAILSENEKQEQQKMVYEALKAIIKNDSKCRINDVNEKLDLLEGDSTDGK